MLKSSLCDCSDAYIFAERTLKITGGPAAADAAARQAEKRNIQVILKTCAPFTDCVSKINNTHLDNAKDLDVVY